MPHCAEVVAVELEFSDCESAPTVDAKNPARSYITLYIYAHLSMCVYVYMHIYVDPAQPLCYPYMTRHCRRQPRF